jgi:hypothetical protein
MTTRARLITVLACSIALLIAAGLMPTGASARPGDTEYEDYAPPKIDCCTNPNYQLSDVKRAFEISRTDHVAGIDHPVPLTSRQGCQECHQSSQPRMGMGDKPRFSYATSLVMNKLAEPVQYKIAKGEKSDWRTYTLEPGHIARHTFTFERDNQERIPTHWIRFADPDRSAGERERQLAMFATPNKKLGKVHFFENNDNGRPNLWYWEPSIERRRSRFTAAPSSTDRTFAIGDNLLSPALVAMVGD